MGTPEQEKLTEEAIANFSDSPEEAAKIDKYRMGAAISFAVMLIVIGIPLWWKTTEVHRASLPYSQIEAMNPASLAINAKLWVSASFPERTNDVIRIMKDAFSDHVILRVGLVPFKVGLDDITYETLERSSKVWFPGQAGDLVLVEVPQIDGTEILLTDRRLIYFTPKADINVMAKVIKEHIFQDSHLLGKLMSIVLPKTMENDDKMSNALRASLNYDVIFTVVNSDPERISIKLDVASQSKKYFQPLLDQVNDISSHVVKSQWLYLLHPSLGETPKTDSTGVNYLSYSQLPHIITPLEKRLGSGISKHPTVHLILYTVACSSAPLKFLSESGDLVDSMISPLWGGIQLLNPEPEHCDNGTTLIPDSQHIMGMFTSQFHSLLGIQTVPEDGVSVTKRRGPLLRGWELDSLYRSRIVEQITSASLTLQSLSKLLGEIGNIVINEDVAGSINSAVLDIYEAKKLLELGKVFEAVDFSKSAFSASERAFSDPSLLALLYFPDDQKYAVYIPLFLPIMIPVMMSLKKISSWVSSKEALSK